MRWLLDTCVVSELARKLPDASVIRWLSQHASEAAMTVVTVGEVQSGIERLAPGRQRNALQHWSDGPCRQCSERIVASDEPVGRTFGRPKASLQAIGKRQDDLDLLIAATATVRQLTLVTRNTRHFEDSGVRTLNPWIAS
ncbi:MAG: plasmid stability protein stbB-like protein [Ramlibacter sp.]|jgi:predicted nucleic acid-binding protein|uniref:type II toxin-antitoxin system VapC family toxin n=1 Tax=Ramlibacter sp. TaxID=1917967 RepID=UPI00260FCA73|nr:type II toxin-antitoxin system VapC family toxin [Ramlibacter sp.]MDB5753168.1 plasmid stability protein stbB-like protein [Ramlibacter sp.]